MGEKDVKYFNILCVSKRKWERKKIRKGFMQRKAVKNIRKPNVGKS